jgi:hypothetical protein
VRSDDLKIEFLKIIDVEVDGERLDLFVFVLFLFLFFSFLLFLTLNKLDGKVNKVSGEIDFIFE